MIVKGATKKILIVTGTRPNFVKVTQFKKVVASFPDLEVEIVHTGQHYDQNMSQVFFEQFGLVPDHFLNIPAGTPVNQIAGIMTGLENLVNQLKPRLLMVVGDVNSTLAGAIVANKTNTPLAHVESGLRSNDRSMPEEINRILTDELTQHFFVTEESGLQNLLSEGKKQEQIHFVGNTMIDTLVAFEHEIAADDILSDLGVSSNDYVLMTIHRPATVDFPEKLKELLGLIEWVLKKQSVVFPIHPRTIQNLRKFGLYDQLVAMPGLHLTDPLGYFSFQKLVADCSLILTDSGGIQEESTFLQKPCLTLRPNTERPVTITIGSNELIADDWSVIPAKIDAILNGQLKKGSVPPLWDGRATQRILEVLEKRI